MFGLFKNKLLTAFDIKIIAVVLMTIDHVGLVFFPGELVFRIIGRLSFPLFAWLIANGARHTKNINKYLIRLFVLGLVSQIPFMLAFNMPFWELNIFFTLFAGLLILKFYIKSDKKVLVLFLLFAAAFVNVFFKFNYGMSGVLSIILFYMFHNDLRLMFFSQFVLFGYYYFLPEFINMLKSSHETVLINLGAFFQPVAAFSVAFVALYNSKPGPKDKYLLYFYYPGHLLILYLIKQLIP